MTNIIEGDGGAEPIRVIQGDKAVFTNDNVWQVAGEPPPADLQVVVTEKPKRVLQKWIDGLPVEGLTRFLRDDEYVDLEALNEKCPKDGPNAEWSLDPGGNPQGPWRIQWIVYLVNMKTMEKITYPTGTTGGRICVEHLKESMEWMEKVRRCPVFPLVSFGTKPMKTKYAKAPRPRPHFVIHDWIGGGGPGDMAITSAPTPLLSPKAETAAETVAPKPKAAPAKAKPKGSNDAEFNDSIPDLGVPHKEKA